MEFHAKYLAALRTSFILGGLFFVLYYVFQVLVIQGIRTGIIPSLIVMHFAPSINRFFAALASSFTRFFSDLALSASRFVYDEKEVFNGRVAELLAQEETDNKPTPRFHAKKKTRKAKAATARAATARAATARAATARAATARAATARAATAKAKKEAAARAATAKAATAKAKKEAAAKAATAKAKKEAAARAATARAATAKAKKEATARAATAKAKKEADTKADAAKAYAKAKKAPAEAKAAATKKYTGKDPMQTTSFQPTSPLADLDECAICFCEKRTVVCMPCRHLCLCDDCAPSIDDCPLCRVPLVSRLRVFN
jgi:hypothetical protein